MVAVPLVPADGYRSPMKPMKSLRLFALAVVIAAILGRCDSDNDASDSSVEASVASGAGQQVDRQPSSELVEKRIAYRDAMRQVVEILERRYTQGTDSFTGLAEANIELAEAELAAAVTQKERHSALGKMLENAKRLEDHARVKTEAGVGRTDELAMATAGRLRAELMLLEEKHRPGAASSTMGTP